MRRLVVNGLLALDKMPYIDWTKALVHPGYTYSSQSQEESEFQTEERLLEAPTLKMLPVKTSEEIPNELMAAATEGDNLRAESEVTHQEEESKILDVDEASG